MTFHEDTQVLRLHLLGMSRLSQRALDYSIKGYELGNPDFCNHAVSAEREIKKLYCQTKYLCLKLVIKGAKSPSDLRFVLAALRVTRALYKTHNAATRIAKTTLLLLANSPAAKYPVLNQFVALTNCLMRLCVVALFEKEISYAEMVVQNRQVCRQCEVIFDRLHRGTNRQMEAAELHALTITRSLGVVAKQTHEIADAILYWLKGTDNALALETDALESQFLKSSPIARPRMSTRHTSLPFPLASCQSGSD